MPRKIRLQVDLDGIPERCHNLLELVASLANHVNTGNDIAVVVAATDGTTALAWDVYEIEAEQPAH